jgi:enoyl-CoA hydratase/carnithine racemase
MGGSFFLTRLVGTARARELYFTGRPVEADEALSLGLLNRVVPDGGLASEAIGWASAIAAYSPVALVQQKRVLRDWTEDAYRAAVAASIDRFAATFEANEATEAMRAMLEKRSPRF